MPPDHDSSEDSIRGISQHVVNSAALDHIDRTNKISLQNAVKQSSPLYSLPRMANLPTTLPTIPSIESLSSWTTSWIPGKRGAADQVSRPPLIDDRIEDDESFIGGEDGSDTYVADRRGRYDKHVPVPRSVLRRPSHSSKNRTRFRRAASESSFSAHPSDYESEGSDDDDQSFIDSDAHMHHSDYLRTDDTMFLDLASIVVARFEKTEIPAAKQKGQFVYSSFIEELVDFVSSLTFEHGMSPFAFFDAVRYRAPRLPMFPDRNEQRMHFITRKVARICRPIFESDEYERNANANGNNSKRSKKRSGSQHRREHSSTYAVDPERSRPRPWRTNNAVHEGRRRREIRGRDNDFDEVQRTFNPEWRRPDATGHGNQSLHAEPLLERRAKPPSQPRQIQPGASPHLVQTTYAPPQPTSNIYPPVESEKDVTVDDKVHLPRSNANGLGSSKAIAADMMDPIACTELRIFEEESKIRQLIMEGILKTELTLKRPLSPDERASYQKHLRKLQTELEDLSRKRPSETQKTQNVTEARKETFYEVPKIGDQQSSSETSIGPKVCVAEIKETQFAPPPQNGSYQVQSSTPGQQMLPEYTVHSTKEALEKTVYVQAPATLPGGYAFEAKIGNTPFLAVVPKGGVKSGQIFQHTIKQEKQMYIPLGHWRHGFFRCLRNGLEHPSLLNGFCCPQVALAQVMSRLHLNSCGNPELNIQGRSQITPVLLASFFFVALHGIFAVLPLESGAYYIFIIQLIPLLLLDLGLIVYFIVVLVKTRRFVREMYKIDESECDDVTMSLCCPCCTITQLMQHTADYDTYRGVCCSGTGLPKNIQALSPMSLPPPQEQDPLSLC